jgi:hypothetical protein
MGIPFIVKVFSMYGIGFVQSRNHVPDNIRVSIFVYCYSGCCMGYVYDCDAVPYIAVFDIFGNLIGYVDELLWFCSIIIYNLLYFYFKSTPPER